MEILLPADGPGRVRRLKAQTFSSLEYLTETSEWKAVEGQLSSVNVCGTCKGAKAMCDKAFKSAWDAIEDDPAQAANMKHRSALMMAISEHI